MCLICEKAVAFPENVISYACNGTWNVHRGKAAATPESASSYACNGTWNVHRGKAAAIRESVTSYAHNGISSSLIRYFFRGCWRS